VFQAWNIIRKRKPSGIFSKGGFVSVPVVMAGKLAGVPVIIHESDLTPGLANKLAKPFASKILTTFPETVKHLDPAKAVHVGAIVREELFQGDAARGREYCGFDEQKPVLLVMGGSLGSRKINETVRANLDVLTGKFQIVHLCGKGNVDPQADRPGYRQYEYIREELPDVLAMADMVVSRAGSNSIFEFLALRKPMLLIPLSRAASRGDQILNARSFKNQGLAEVLEEEQITDESFLEAVLSVYERREEFLANMQRHDSRDSLSTVIGLIKQSAGC
jgi:UDP-N-acetylglucosamine--N-acetylmuramyl-(pentapeptide) pyrophosphoryl-undecaprenol N-acetylglucosamine transferase